MDRTPGHLTSDPTQAVTSLIWIKVVGLGSLGSGKTCLIKHFCESSFSPGYQPTVGVDYGFKIQSVGDLEVRVHLWDLSGHPDYADVRNELYGNTDAVFVTYDVTDKSSFDNVRMWQQELQRYSNNTADVTLVANKIDIRAKRTVTSQEGKKLANQHSWTYHETSCSTGEGVSEMFEGMLKRVLKTKGILP